MLYCVPQQALSSLLVPCCDFLALSQARNSMLRRGSSASVGDLPDVDSLTLSDAPQPLRKSYSAGTGIDAPHHSDADSVSGGGGGGYYMGTPRATGDATTGFADVPAITDEDAEAMLQEFMAVSISWDLLRAACGAPSARCELVAGPPPPSLHSVRCNSVEVVLLYIFLLYIGFLP
jgi:hypothetical protein